MTQSLPPKSLVLYADDDADDIELVSDAFREYSQNIDLLTFEDGVALIDYVSSLDGLLPDPCLFILDINMPRLNGKETLKQLKTMDRFSQTPVVLFSTSTLPSDAQFASQYNAGFVTKPLDGRQIYHIVDQIVEHCNDDVKKFIRNMNGK